MLEENPDFIPHENCIDRYNRDATWRQNMQTKNKLDVADLEQRWKDALEFEQEGPSTATRLPRWVVQEQ